MQKKFLIAALAGAFMTAGGALAQTYPSKPVKIMVPFAAGGIADITTRFVADRLSTKLGQQFCRQHYRRFPGYANPQKNGQQFSIR